ncbi:MAG: TylF/MycF/NovP-related O-methyltransferase [Pseudomonadota bacterium]
MRKNFQTFGLLDDQVRFLKGWFKDQLPTAPIDRLALIRLDADYHDSTRDCLIGLYDRLSPGGYVIVDDYGETEWTGCREAVDAFRAARNIDDPLIPVDRRCWYWQRRG